MSTVPHPNEAEITLIGSGGYGETIIVNIGNNNWIIIDSCINPNTKSPLAIEYLNSLDINIEKDVKLIICTHWHDDHILGVSKVFDACKSAKLCFSKAHDKTKFLRFISFDLEKTKSESRNSSTKEFNRCIDIANERKTSIVTAIENRKLYSLKINDTLENQIFSLSPSDYTMEKFDHEISELITEFGSPSKKVSINSPNSKSVAVYVKLGFHSAILGADLEISSDAREGWQNVLDNSIVVDTKASLFKIPHHGSENGYHERVWKELVSHNAIAKLTPWNKGRGLPDPNMLKKYCEHTEDVFMTSPYINNSPKKRDKQIEKLIKRLNVKLKEVKFNKGIIRCRIKIDDPQAKWEVELFENAFKVNDALKASR